MKTVCDHLTVHMTFIHYIVLVQEDQRFLQELFAQLQDETIPEEKYRELVSIYQYMYVFIFG